MNQELVQQVRALKMQSKTDQEIITSLSTRFSTSEIQSALQALQYMRPTHDSSEDVRPPVKKTPLWRRYIYKISPILFVLLLFVVIPRIYKTYTVLGIQKSIDHKILKKADLDTSYDLGSVSSCTSTAPARIGDVTNHNACTVVTARLYFPRYHAKDTIQTTFGEKIPRHIFEYTDSKGTPLGDYAALYRADFNQGSLRKEFNLGSFDHIGFSGLDSTLEDANPVVNLPKVNNKWNWVDESTWLGTASSAKKFQQQISDIILSGESPAAGAPGLEEAIFNNRAPLVIYMVTRYCHSAPVVLLDNFCLLPH